MSLSPGELAAGERLREPAAERNRVLRKLLRDRAAMTGLVVLLLLILGATLAPWLTRYDPYDTELGIRLQPPGPGHLLGTDEVGRDVFTRLLYGGRLSLLVGIVSMGIGLVLGVAIGAVAGYYRPLDNPIMRIIDVIMAFPAVLLAMAIVGALGPGLVNVMIAVGVSTMPSFVRVFRSSVLSVREQDFVQAGQAMGASDWHVIWNYIIPNSLAPVIVYASLQLGNAILSAAILSFLGMGVQPPLAEWGSMVTSGRNYLFQAPHVSTIPSLAIFLTVLCFNLLGDGIRDALDPRVRE